MLDTYVRPLADYSPLSKLVPKVAQSGITANQLTIVGFFIGVLACAFVMMEQYAIGLILLLVNRLIDGLDGAVARLTAPTDYGRYLDIVLNTIFHAGFVFAFAFGASEYDNDGAALFLLFSYLGLTCSALAYTKPESGSPFHPASLIGGTETFIFMVLCCLLPPNFSAFALIFAILCWITVVGRFALASKNLQR